MFEMMQNCPRCGESASVKIGQSKLGGKLRWFESTRCSNCDFMSESDDCGFPPEDIRKKLQEVGGAYRVRILNVASLIDLVKPLRLALNLPPCAIVGAWQVDDAGDISGGFIKNPNYVKNNSNDRPQVGS